MASSEHICTASFEGVAFLLSLMVSKHRVEEGESTKVIASLFLFSVCGGWIVQVNLPGQMKVLYHQSTWKTHLERTIGVEAVKALAFLSLSVVFNRKQMRR